MPALSVLHVVGSLDVGGIEQYLLDFVPEARSHGVRTDIVTLFERRPGQLAGRFEALGCRIFACHALRRRHRLAADLKRAAEESGAHVLHSHLGELSGDPLRVLRNSGIRAAVVQAHDLGGADGWARACYRFVSHRWTLRFASRLLAVSPEAGRRLAASSGRKVSIVPVGIDVRQWRPDPRARRAKRDELGLDDSTPLLLHVGRFHPVKNHPFLLLVAQELRRRGFHVVLALVGEGRTLPRVKSQAERMGLDDTVRFLGRRADVPQLMNAADLLLLPSLAEGLSRVLLEAAAVGLPFLATANADLTGVFSGSCQLPVAASARTPLHLEVGGQDGGDGSFANHELWAESVIARLQSGAEPMRPLIDLSIERAVAQTLTAYN